MSYFILKSNLMGETFLPKKKKKNDYSMTCLEKLPTKQRIAKTCSDIKKTQKSVNLTKNYVFEKPVFSDIHIDLELTMLCLPYNHLSASYSSSSTHESTICTFFQRQKCTIVAYSQVKCHFRKVCCASAAFFRAPKITDRTNMKIF